VVVHRQKTEARPSRGRSDLGDAYTFVAIERHSKLVRNIALGKRDQATTDVFIEGLRHATAPETFQITTDGFAPYRTAIPNTLEDRCDYAMLIKVYKAASEGEGRYSPAEVASVALDFVNYRSYLNTDLAHGPNVSESTPIEIEPGGTSYNVITPLGKSSPRFARSFLTVDDSLSVRAELLGIPANPNAKEGPARLFVS
jgi:hypothetical protein